MSVTTTTNYTIVAYSVDLLANSMQITVHHTDATDGSLIAVSVYSVQLVAGYAIMDNKARVTAASTPNSIITGQTTFQGTLQTVLDSAAAAGKIKP